MDIQMHRQAGKRSLGGEVYAVSEMIDHRSLLREFREHFFGLAPGMVGLGGCESSITHLKNEKTLTEKFLARYFLPLSKHWRCRSWAMFIGFRHRETRRMA